MADIKTGRKPFIQLTDVPASYVGSTLRLVRVNAGETGLEFAALSAVLSFLDLTDTPNSYVGQTLRIVRVNAAETGLEFAALSAILSFLDLTDTPNSYVGQTLRIVRVNAAETGLEFAALSTVLSFLDLTDTPNSYVGFATNRVTINSLETGLQFVADTFLEEQDTPDSYVGQAGNFVNVNAGETAVQFVTPGAVAGIIQGSLTSEITNKGRQWIQHGNNVITLRKAQLDNNFIIKATILLPQGAIDNANPITYRGVYHAGSAQANSMAITCRPETTTRFSIKLNGGFGFTSGGNTGVVSTVTQRFDDVANSQTARTGLTTARDSIAGFSLNGLGFTCGGDTGAVSGVVERFDDANNTHTSRTSMAPANERTGMFTLNGRGFIQGGNDGAAIIYGITNRFDDISNIWQARTGLITPRFDLSGFGINNFGFSVAGDTIIGAGGVVSNVERFDDIANTNTNRALVTTARDTIGTYVIDEFGFASGGINDAGTIFATTERFDDTTNIWITVTSLATPRFAMENGYSLNGFGFTSCGAVAGPANSGITDRYDNVANTHTLRTAATARAAPGEYATNEFFVEYNTENVSEFDEIWNLGTTWIAHGDNVITLPNRHNNLDFRSEIVLQLPLGATSGANQITYRGVGHSRPMAITCRPDDPFIGFGFISAGVNAAVVIIGTTERYNDPTQVTTTRTAATARNHLAGYSMLGFGFTSCGTTTGAPAGKVGTTERFDDAAGVQTARTAATARIDLASFVLTEGFNVDLTSRGHTVAGNDNVAPIVNTHEEFNDITDLQTLRAGVTTARSQLAGFSINQFGFAVGGTTTGAVGGITNVNQRYDLIADAWSARAALAANRMELSGFAFGGFGYVSGGTLTAAAMLATTDRYNNVSDSWTNVGNMNTARDQLADYAILGFGFATCGNTNTDAAPVTSAVVNRYDPNTTIWTARAPVPALTSRRQHAAYANPTRDPTNGARLLVRFHGGFGFVAGGDNTGVFTPVANIQRYDDVAQTWSPQAGAGSMANLTQARMGACSYTLNGLGFIECGATALVPGTITSARCERFDDIINSSTQRQDNPASRYSPTGYSLNGLGITSGGFIAAVSGATYSFDDTSNTHSAALALITARYDLAGYSLNGFGFTSGGFTGVITGVVERFDIIANIQTARDPLSQPRTTVKGFALNGFGFTSCGATAGPVRVGTTERFDDIAGIQTDRASATARSYLAEFALNGFGFTSCGFTGVVVATSQRLDDIANIWTSVTVTNLLARQLATGFATNEYFVNYSTMN